MAVKLQVKSLAFFHRLDNKAAILWKEKITLWLARKHPKIKIGVKNPEVLITLGGDGAILEAARVYQRYSPVILGLNLGKVGFLTSAREEKKFLAALDAFFKRRYLIVKRLALAAKVVRNGKIVFSTNALNEIVAQNPLGMVELEVLVEGFPVQYIHGSGVIVATSTGSTGYNLSNHGPIIVPEIPCLIINEVMDHNIPTPPLVVRSDSKVEIKIVGFRERRLLAINKTREPFDVLLVADGSQISPLRKSDIIKIAAAPKPVRFAELEKNYFFKSLQEKFAFK